MKISCIGVVLLAFGIAGMPAAQPSTAAAHAAKPRPTRVPAPTAYWVIDAGANHRVWQNETYEKSSDDQIHTNIHTFTELSSGLNYLRAGQWVESKEQIEVCRKAVRPPCKASIRPIFQAIFTTGSLNW